MRGLELKTAIMLQKGGKGFKINIYYLYCSIYLINFTIVTKMPLCYNYHKDIK